MRYEFFRLVSFENGATKGSNCLDYYVALLILSGLEESKVRTEIHTVMRDEEKDYPVYGYRGFTITNQNPSSFVVTFNFDPPHLVPIAPITIHSTLNSALDYIDKHLNDYARNFVKAARNPAFRSKNINKEYRIRYDEAMERMNKMMMNNTKYPEDRRYIRICKLAHGTIVINYEADNNELNGFLNVFDVNGTGGKFKLSGDGNHSEVWFKMDDKFYDFAKTETMQKAFERFGVKVQ